MGSKSKEQVERTIARQVCNELIIATPTETGNMCIYEGGKYVYGNKAENLIKNHIKQVAFITEIIGSDGKGYPYNLSMSKQAIIIDFIKAFSACSLEEFDADDNIINLKNGLLYLDGYKIPGTEEDHDGVDEDFYPDERIRYYRLRYFEEHNTRREPYKSFIQIPVNYKEGAKCPEVHKVLTDIFNDDTPLIYEMLGYFMLPTVKYSKAFMLYGDTGTGKTTAINIINKFIGRENISGIELQLLSQKFEIEKTRNKLLNIFDDLGSQPISYVGNFKGLVTNTYMRGRIKHVQYEVDWINKCKNLFACNELPSIKKYVTDAFYKRWVLEPCSNEFKALGIEDKNIREKQYSEDEMSGLLNKAIEGIKRLEERGGFPEKWQDIEFVKNYWNMDINPIGLFIDECCELSEHQEVDYDIFYGEINKYRRKKMVKDITKTKMTRAINRFYDEKIKKTRVGKKSPQIDDFPSGYKFEGVGFKLDYVLKPLEMEPKVKKTKLEEFLKNEDT